MEAQEVRTDLFQPMGEDQIKQVRDYVDMIYARRQHLWDITLNTEKIWEERITPELVQLFCDGLEDYNLWYDAMQVNPPVGESPFGPAVIPPLMISERCSNYLWLDGFIPAGGMHVCHDSQVFNPCPIGSLLRFHGKLVRKYIWKGRRVIEIEFTVEDAETGTLYVKEMRKSIATYRRTESKESEGSEEKA
jgi:hypothetical protein